MTSGLLASSAVSIILWLSAGGHRIYSELVSSFGKKLKVMNKVNSSYYRLGIVIGLSLLCVLVYSVLSYYKVRKVNDKMLDGSCQKAEVVYKDYTAKLNF